MKKYILLLFICFSTGMVHAGGHLFLTGGVNISTLGSQDVDERIQYWPQMGFNAGLAYELSFTDYFGLQAGFSYETRGESGGKILGAKGTSDSSWVVRYRYMQVPVLVRISRSLGEGRMELFAGPELGHMLSNGRKEIFPVQEDSGAVYEYDIAGEKKNEVGITLGIGYQIPVTFGVVYLRPSYYYSLQKLNDAGRNHRNVKFQLGYGINL